MKRKVVIFGGAFDPPHLGHRKVIAHLMNRFQMDEVLVMPCGIHKIKGEIGTNTLDRLEMAKLAFSNIPGVVVSTIDIDLSKSNKEVPGKGSTYNLLRILEEEYKAKSIDVELYFVIGQDNADTIEKWYRWEELINKWRFIVLPRDNELRINDWYHSYPHIYLNDFDLINISSTEIRKRCSSEFLVDDVHSFILEKGLYKN